MAWPCGVPGTVTRSAPTHGQTRPQEADTECVTTPQPNTAYNVPLTRPETTTAVGLLVAAAVAALTLIGLT